MMLPLAIQLIILLGFPLLAQVFFQDKWLSPVVLAYAGGLLAGTLIPGVIHSELAGPLSEGSIMLAIPLLLFGTRLQHFREKTGKAMYAFAFCVIAGMTVSFFAPQFLGDSLPDSSRLSAMLVGLYTGGTPNMQAIGMGLGVTDETIILVNAADVVTGGAYLLFLTSLAPWLFGKILPVATVDADEMINLEKEKIIPTHAIKAVLLALTLAGISIGSVFLVFGNMEKVSWIILMLTTLSLLASSTRQVKSWQGIYPLATYFLLVFCFALGTLADFRNIMDQGTAILTYTFIVMCATIILHLALCRIFGIDRDTFMIASTAALFGPAFIGQIAGVLRNPGLVVQGMLTGLLGYAIGNYLGFLLFWLLETF